MKARPISFSFSKLSERNAKKLLFILGPVLILLIVITALFPLLDGDSRKHEAATYSMDTYVQQTVYGKDREVAAKTAANAIQTFDELASWDGEQSEIYELNAQAGKEWMTLSEDIFSVLVTVKGVSEKSEGAFDITLAPVSRLWDFENMRCEVPDSELISKLLEYVGHENFRLGMADSSASLKYNGNAVDLTPVLHGEACNKAIDIYKELNVTGAIVSVGRSVGLFGKKPDGTLWNAALPAPDGTDAIGTVSVKEGFLSTASVYENAFTEGETLYHSILDPKTGYPAETDLASITVLSEDGVLSDALSRACIVLGYEKSLSLLEAYGAEAVFVDNDNSVTATPGLTDSVSLTDKNFTLHK